MMMIQSRRVTNLVFRDPRVVQSFVLSRVHHTSQVMMMLKHDHQSSSWWWWSGLALRSRKAPLKSLSWFWIQPCERWLEANLWKHTGVLWSNHSPQTHLSDQRFRESHFLKSKRKVHLIMIDQESRITEKSVWQKTSFILDIFWTKHPGAKARVTKFKLKKQVYGVEQGHLICSDKNKQ